MNYKDVTVYFEERRLKAVSDALAANGETVEERFNKTFKFLYEQFVPIEQQTVIEAEIREQEATEQAAAEAKRRFAVFHVRQNGRDSYFTNDLFLSFLSAAYRYRLYDRGELSEQPEMFAEAFMGSQSISHEEYQKYGDKMSNDIRIRALIDFDLDEGLGSVCERSDQTWSSYKLHDVSVAAYKAQRSDYRTTEDRMGIFRSALTDKALDDECFTMQM